MRVMMSAAGSPVAPGIIRHLQSLGHYVIGHDMNSFGAGLGICDEWHTSPPVTAREYTEFIWNIDHDIYLAFMDEELMRLSPTVTNSIFTSKMSQQKEMETAGLPVAPTAHHGRVVAKPFHGRGGKGIIFTEDQTMIGELAFAGYLIQQWIDGDEFTIDVLTGLRGDFLFAVPRRRLAVSGGVSIVGKIEMDATLIALARLVCRKFKFYGPINIQIIREKGTGRLFIIEVNARLSGSCMFTVLAGFDILDATIRLHQFLPFEPPAKVDEIVVRRHYVEERL